MIIAVGSTNKTKIDPVKDVFSKHFKNVKVVAVKVESGVSHGVAFALARFLHNKLYSKNDSV